MKKFICVIAIFTAFTTTFESCCNEPIDSIRDSESAYETSNSESNIDSLPKIVQSELE